MRHYLLILCISILFMACGTESKEAAVPLKASLISNAQAAPQNAKIVFEFSSDIDALSVTVDSFIVRDANGVDVNGTRSVLGKLVSFSITGIFPLNQTFNVTLTRQIKDVLGNALAQSIVQTISITSTDVLAPFILGSSLDKGTLSINSNLSIQMSENLDPTTINSTSLELFDSSNIVVLGTVSYAQGLIKFVPNVNLLIDTNYKLVFSGTVKDLSGNIFLASKEYTFLAINSIGEGRFSKDVNTLNVNMRINSAIIEGDIMYVASSDNEVGIFSLVNIPTISEQARISLSSEAVDMVKAGSYLFVSTLASGLVVIDVSNPLSASVVSSLDLNTSIFKMHLVGSTLHLSSTINGVQVVDITNPLVPILISSIDTADAAYDVYSLNANLTYVADKTAGLSLVDTSTSSLVKSLSTNSIARSLLVVNNLLYLANSSLGVEIYDITEPLNPLYLSTLSTLSYAFDLHHATNGNNSYLYVADKDKGIRIFDVTNTSNISAVSQLSTQNRVFALLEYKSMLFALNDTGTISIYSLFPDLISPSVLSTDPSAGEIDVLIDQNISIVFSEDVVFTDINNIATIVDTSGANVAYTSSYDATLQTLLLVPTQNLNEITEYTVSLNGEVKDLVGNIFSNVPFIFNFTTLKGAPSPTVISSTPSDTSTVNSVSSIVVEFSEDMDATTVISAHLELIDDTSQVYTGTVSYINKVLTFQPSTSLPEGKTYTFTVFNSVTSLEGISLSADKRISFTTNIAPTVISSSPADGSTVSSVSTIIIEFSEEMETATMISSNFNLVDNTSQEHVGTVSYTNKVLTFVPPSDLFTGRTYTLTVSSVVADLAGKTLAADKVITFTISSATNATPPVTLLSPRQGDTVLTNFGDIYTTLRGPVDTSSFLANSVIQTATDVRSITVILFTKIKVVIRFSTLLERLSSTITTGVKDSLGENMASIFVLTYQTAAS